MNKYIEITKMIIAIIFVAGTILSFFHEMNAIGEELVRLITIAILSYYFAQSGGFAGLLSKK